MAESLDAQQASVGRVADPREIAQVGQPFPQVEVQRVVDRGLGSKRSSFLVVLLDLRVLVLHVQARGDPFGDDAGGERPRGAVLPAAVEYQPVQGRVTYRWPGSTWSHSLDGVAEGAHVTR